MAVKEWAGQGQLELTNHCWQSLEPTLAQWGGWWSGRWGSLLSNSHFKAEALPSSSFLDLGLRFVFGNLTYPCRELQVKPSEKTCNKTLTLTAQRLSNTSKSGGTFLWRSPSIDGILVVDHPLPYREEGKHELGCSEILAESTKCCYHSGPDYGVKSTTAEDKHYIKPKLFAVSLILLLPFSIPLLLV